MKRDIGHMVQSPALQTRRTSLLCRTVLSTIVLMLAACATQPSPQLPEPIIAEPQVSAADQAVLRSLISHQDRLYRVAGPLLVSSPDLCKGNARN